MTVIFEMRSAELRQQGERLIREADDLLCQSWNERRWSKPAAPIDPSPYITQALNGGYPMLEIECSRCHTARTVDLAELKRPATTFVHDLAGRLVCTKCQKAGKRPAAALKQLAHRRRTIDPT